MITFKELAELFFGKHSIARPPIWPSDLFAVSAAYFEQTGAYSRTVSLSKINSSGHITSLAHEWEDNFNYSIIECRKSHLEELPDYSLWIDTLKRFSKSQPSLHPERVLECWNQAIAGNDSDYCAHLLLSVADSMSAGFGVSEPKNDVLLQIAEDLLRVSGSRTVCYTVPTELGVVLPKQHCAQVGLTLRGLSHNLAWIRPSGVTCRWHQSDFIFNPLSQLDLILLPWPLSIRKDSFSFKPSSKNVFGEGIGLFEYTPFHNETFRSDLRNVLKNYRAEKQWSIALVVFPEMSLSNDMYFEACAECEEFSIGLIAGVHVVNDGLIINESRALPQLAVGAKRKHNKDIFNSARRQSKHHRWSLNRSQILQYKLGGILPANTRLWENISIPERTLHFNNLGQWLCFVTMICEDLARQEPASGVIRSIGPNLVIALLMDGPQLRTRWGGRYASIFAEDPGSSVLTVTSLGMCKLSTPRGNDVDQSNVIALWRDAIYGERELDISTNALGGVLTICEETREEFTADGRGDDNSAHFPVFSGWSELTLS